MFTLLCFFDFRRKTSVFCLLNMFLYTGKYTESEYDIQNNNLLYKTDQQCQNTFEFVQNLGKFRNISKTSFFYFVICIIVFYKHDCLRVKTWCAVMASEDLAESRAATTSELWKPRHWIPPICAGASAPPHRSPGAHYSIVTKNDKRQIIENETIK